MTLLFCSSLTHLRQEVVLSLYPSFILSVAHATLIPKIFPHPTEGSWPAGIDTSYPKKAIYPGVIAFYKELDLGIVGDDEWDNSRLGNLVFLSARPHVYKDVSENVTYQKLRRLQVTRGLHTSPSLLAGMVQHSTVQYAVHYGIHYGIVKYCYCIDR